MSDTIGPQIIDTWRGWLRFEYLPDDLQRAEDSTQAFDFGQAQRCCGVSRFYDSETCVWFYVRAATDAEQTLLAHLGYAIPAEGDDGYPLETRVEWQTETLRKRRWPALETTETETETQP